MTDSLCSDLDNFYTCSGTSVYFRLCNIHGDYHVKISVYVDIQGPKLLCPNPIVPFHPTPTSSTQFLVQFHVLAVPNSLAYLHLSVFLTILEAPRCLSCLHFSTCIRYKITLKYHLLQKFSTEFCTLHNTKIKNTDSKP